MNARTRAAIPLTSQPALGQRAGERPYRLVQGEPRGATCRCRYGSLGHAPCPPSPVVSRCRDLWTLGAEPIGGARAASSEGSSVYLVSRAPLIRPVVRRQVNYQASRVVGSIVRGLRFGWRSRVRSAWVRPLRRIASLRLTAVSAAPSLDSPDRGIDRSNGSHSNSRAFTPPQLSIGLLGAHLCS